MNRLVYIQTATGHLEEVSSIEEAPMRITKVQEEHPSSTSRVRSWLNSVRIGITAYGSALVITGIMVPFVSSIFVVGCYLAPRDIFINFFPFLQSFSPSWYPLVCSGLLIALCWACVALLFTPFVNVRMANARSYSLLKSRLCQLKSNLGIEGSDDKFKSLEQQYSDIRAAIDEIKKIREMKSAEDDKYSSDNYSLNAREEALSCYINISEMLRQGPTNLSWSKGTGYVNAWSLLHHAEEALIEVLCIPEVIRDALHDYSAIHGSTIENSASLLARIKQAVKTLQPGALVYFDAGWPKQVKKACSCSCKFQVAVHHVARTQQWAPTGAEKAAKNRENLHAEAIARVTLREVKNALNDFRDRCWEGLVLARNRLLAAIVLTGVVTHILLSFAILASGSTSIKSTLIAAASFYLVGAVTGLFSRFYRESVKGTTIEDFGFTAARLVATPLISGLAAIGGVLIMVALPAFDAVQHAGTVNLNDVFSLSPSSLLIAAVFGLAPGLLFKGLQEKAKKFETNLISSTTTVSQVKNAVPPANDDEEEESPITPEASYSVNA